MLYHRGVKILRGFDVLFMCNANSGDQLLHWAAVEELVSNAEKYDGHS